MINKYETLEQFKSVNKNVALINYMNGKAVLKLYPTEDDLEKESSLMQLISHTGYAPKVLFKESNYVICELIDGESFQDAFVLATMTDNKEKLVDLAQSLSIFMQMFHSVTGDKILGDIDFRNFVLQEERCVGVSFVGAKEGMPYQDVAEVVAYAISNTVGDLYSCVPFVDKMIKSFHLTMMDIINDLSDALDKYDKKHILDKQAVLDACVKYDENDTAWKFFTN